MRAIVFLLSVRPEQVKQAEVVAGRVPPPGAFKKAKRAETLDGQAPSPERHPPGCRILQAGGDV